MGLISRVSSRTYRDMSCDEIEIESIEPVFVWFWDSDCEYCPICRALMTEECVNCQTINEASCGAAKQNECAVVWGKCEHAFHKCCIKRWLDGSIRCPLCQQDWKEN